MGWDARISARPRGHEPAALFGEWNYTHNTSPMISRVLDVMGAETSEPWYRLLDGMNGAEGGHYLDLIIGGLSEAPELFRAMNPSNGWGDYDSLLEVLAEMRDTSHAHPRTGLWSASG